MRLLNGSVAVVTGGGSGIGRALTHELASQGVHVVVADLDQNRAEAAANEVTCEFGIDAVGVGTDVSDPASVADLAEYTYERFGRVDILCNNAGVATTGAAWEASVTDWQFVFGVNLMGVVHGIRAFVPRMLAAGIDGHVVNTCSMGGLIPIPLKAPYTASKHAVVGLSTTLRADLLAVGSSIAVTVACPGAVATNMIDAQRAHGESDDNIARAQTAMRVVKATEAVRMSAEAAAQIIVASVVEGRFWAFPNAAPFFGAFDQMVAEIDAARQVSAGRS
jgi:NAD(P)-dependent dehydrogenase (short-subunit alcohol dehydrogenase family)